MMETATANLESDHVQILHLIEVMERMALLPDPDMEHLELIVKVIREFADGLHHAKEEQLLFPLMVQKGFSTGSGPVAVMLHEHEGGRNYVKIMAESIARCKTGDPGALTSVYSAMLGYADLLRNHIAKENNVLFRMADKMFTESEQQDLLQAFAQVESKATEGSSKAEYVSVIHTLAKTYTSRAV